MEVDFAGGTATVEPAEGESFDPRELRRAITEAGFSAPEVEIVVVGTLWTGEDGLTLVETPGPVPIFVLAGGARLSELGERDDLLGQPLRISGRLHPDHGEHPPGMTVEEWEHEEGPGEPRSSPGPAGRGGVRPYFLWASS